MRNVLPLVTTQLLNGLRALEAENPKEWAVLLSVFVKNRDGLKEKMLAQRRALPMEDRKKKGTGYVFTGAGAAEWSKCSEVLLDRNHKRLGFINVAAGFYLRHDAQGKTSHSYDDNTTDTYNSTVVFEQRGTKSAEEYVKGTSHAFQKTMSGRSQSGMLVRQRYRHVEAIVEWEEDFMLKGIKNKNGEVVQHWYKESKTMTGIAPVAGGEVCEIEYPDDLREATLSVNKCKTDRTLYRRILQIFEELPYLVRMNDDSRQWTPVYNMPPTSFPHAAIKRAESVVESYFEGITRLLVWSNVVGKWKLEGQNHSKKKRCFYPFG